MADVQKGWAFTLSNEDKTPPTGKVTTEPNGGKARLGINSIAHPEALERGFYEMPLAEALDYAEDCYKYCYWALILGYNIESQVIASKWADMAFNENPHQATLLVQRALNAVRRAGQLEVKVDGSAGPLTIARVNTYLDDGDDEVLYQAIAEEGRTFYMDLQAAHPDKYPLTDLASWLHRLGKRPPA